MDGMSLLSRLPPDSIPVVFFDPQYRGVYEMMQYGNEDTSRNHKRVEIPQMDDDLIRAFIERIAGVTMPSGHVFLWVDKFHLCTNFRRWFEYTKLEPVDMITWNKQKIGLGYRTRHTSEFLLVLQKIPKRAKGVWIARDIPDVWNEKVVALKEYHHLKPIGLQARLIEAVTNKNDVVVDPAAGSYSVLESCMITGRRFLGCDVRGWQGRPANARHDVSARAKQSRLPE